VDFQARDNGRSARYSEHWGRQLPNGRLEKRYPTKTVRILLNIRAGTILSAGLQVEKPIRAAYNAGQRLLVPVAPWYKEISAGRVSLAKKGHRSAV
jgi:hypothetical protein